MYRTTNNANSYGQIVLKKNTQLGMTQDIVADNSGDDCDDCLGEPNGNATEDQCGVCDNNPANDNSTCTDCAGVVNGDSAVDLCGVCDDDLCVLCVLCMCVVCM